MGKLIMWNLVTLDGYFEGPNHDLSMHQDVWGEELEAFSIEQLEGAGALLFGRVTYDLMAAHWPPETGVIADFMNALPKVVSSRARNVRAGGTIRAFRPATRLPRWRSSSATRRRTSCSSVAPIWPQA